VFRARIIPNKNSPGCCSEANAAKIMSMLSEMRAAGAEMMGKLDKNTIMRAISGLNDAKQNEIVNTFYNIIQPWRNVQKITIPYIADFFTTLCNRELRPYKGVSYNPFVPAYGENFSILDFFSYLKSLDSDGIVLNASKYAVINLSKRIPATKYSKDVASEVVDFLEESLDEFPEVRESAEIRNSYLNAISVALFPCNKRPLVIDAEEMWKSRSYLKCLQNAIEFCASIQGSKAREGCKLRIKKYAKYKRYDKEFHRWYSVLVLAEALYLNKEFGVNVKLGPTTESNFDSLIRELMKAYAIDYGFIWYSRKIERELAYNELIFFRDTPKDINKKLRNKKLFAWMKEIVSAFVNPMPADRSALTNTIAELIEMINRVADKKPKMPLVEGEWWLLWPPGSCD